MSSFHFAKRTGFLVSSFVVAVRPAFACRAHSQTDDSMFKWMYHSYPTIGHSAISGFGQSIGSVML
jgi:hypothetical protein